MTQLKITTIFLFITTHFHFVEFTLPPTSILQSSHYHPLSFCRDLITTHFHFTEFPLSLTFAEIPLPPTFIFQRSHYHPHLVGRVPITTTFILQRPDCCPLCRSSDSPITQLIINLLGTLAEETGRRSLLNRPSFLPDGLFGSGTEWY